MALKIRQKKQQEPQKVHPQYQPNTGTHWAEQYREDNKASFRKSFAAIIVLLVVLVIILIVAAITAVAPSHTDTSAITASQTYTVSQMELDQMKDDATTFAQGILIYAYCSDEDTAVEGKTAAMRTMANSTQSYTQIESLMPVSRLIAPENFAPVVTEITMQDTTTAYASSFTFEYDAVAADTSIVDENNPNGTFIDNGYHFTVTFNNAQADGDASSKWVISDCQIKAK